MADKKQYTMRRYIDAIKVSQNFQNGKNKGRKNGL